MGSQRVTEKSFVLDTCAWIWIAQGDTRITKNIQNKLIESNWLVSAISVWEVAMLVKKKRIELSCSLQHWIKAALIEEPKLNLVPLTPEIAIASCNLDNDNLSDPADKIILATAIEYNAIVVTGDEKIITYCDENFLPILKL